MGDDLLARLASASARAAELAAALAAERERRNQLVIEAKDAGHSWRQVATAASLGVSTCESIVARN